MSYKKDRLTSLLAHLAAEFLNKEAAKDSMITVTGVNLSENNENADILFTVFPENKERSALGFTQRHISDLREFIKEKSRLGKIPRIEFKLDLGEKHRQKIDELINKNIQSE